MLYFDHAATNFPKHPVVGEAIQQLLLEGAVNPGRGGYRLSTDLSRKIDQLRQLLAEHYQARHAERVILTSNCTDALNLGIHGWLETVCREQSYGEVLPHVICTAFEHNSVLRPLYRWREQGRISLSILDLSPSGLLKVTDLKQQLRSETCLVVVSQLNNTLGIRQNLLSLGRTLKNTNAKLLVDAAQSAGHELTLMQDWGVDMLAMAGHKGWGGPTGIGALILGDGIFDESGQCLLSPMKQGGTGGDSLSEYQPKELPVTYESGTVNTVGAIGWLAAIKQTLSQWQDQEDHDTLSFHSVASLRIKRLADTLAQELKSMKGCELYGPEDRTETSGIVLFNFKQRPAQEVEQILDSVFQIALRSGLHCAPKAHEALGSAPHGALRVAFGPEHGEDELEQLLDALREIEGSS